jgi:hypothetical protein
MNAKKWRVQYRDGVSEPNRAELESYLKAAEEAMRGCPVSVLSKTLGDDAAAVEVALSALALLKRN